MPSLDFEKACKNVLLKIGAAVVKKAKEESPIKSGLLRRSITMDTSNINNLEVKIGVTTSAPYAEYVHEGTGIHGKHKTPIVPKKKKALKTPYGYRKSVKGQKPNKFLERAAEKVLNENVIRSALKESEKEFADAIVKAIKSSLVSKK
ncbi:MAG: HK97 gp10 family phage protein [Helicobacteraceae bacterium]|jgi:HK97 gp10 family phage protein|nr:HK97 gp10 family phage protein [Helicobacteraceae bacterium]